MTELLRVNQSRLRRFDRCEAEWYDYVVQGLYVLDPAPSAARDRGKVFHALLEYALLVYAKTGRVYDFTSDDGYDTAKAIYHRLWRDEQVSVDEETAHELFAAAKFHIPRLKLHEWDVVHVDGKPLIEADLRAPFVDDTQLQAIIDVVLQHRESGKIWYIDFKTTTYQLKRSERRPWARDDYQLFIGREILRHHGIDVNYSTLLYLRSVAPRPPELTTRGRISVNKAKLSCDWPTFRQALVDNGEDPNSESAIAVAEYLRDVTYEMWVQDITKPAAENTMRVNLKDAARRMLALAEGRAKPHYSLRTQNPRSGCNVCDFRVWCQAERDGASTDSLVDTHYEARPWGKVARRRDAQPVVVHLKRFVRDADDYTQWCRMQGRSLSPTEDFRP